jgi:hypothetical protein
MYGCHTRTSPEVRLKIVRGGVYLPFLALVGA